MIRNAQPSGDLKYERYRRQRTCSRCGRGFLTGTGETRCGDCRYQPRACYEGPKLGAELSQREIQVTRMVATGVSNKVIADALHLTKGTIRVYLSHQIFIKTGVKNRTGLAIWWLNRESKQGSE